MKPYYQDAHVTLYHGSCLEMTDWTKADVMVTDPPYGINYETGRAVTLPASIAGDEDTTARDVAIWKWRRPFGMASTMYGASPDFDRPALVFGTWRIPRPEGTRMVLVWDTKGALGMGDLSLPWKPAHQEVYVLGTGFTGKRTTDVLTYAPVQSMAKNGRVHPHQKPVDLLCDLIQKCPPGTVVDPFAGSGSSLVAAKSLGRRAIGIELDERYCEIAARRLSQEVLDFGGAA